MSLQKIKTALATAYKAAGFFTDANTAIENVAYTPPTNDTPWARLHFVPNQPDVATLGAGGEDRVDGFFQIDLNYPLNTGDKAANDKADAIRLVFTAGARFAYSGQEVVIASCGRSQGRVQDGFWKVVVTVAFYAYITR